jgi:phosphatidylglycerophosphate synthase
MSTERWSELHSDVEVKGIVKYWFIVSKYLAWPFIVLRISPNIISFSSILISLPLIFDRSLWWLVIVALILDGIDGRVAIERKMESKLGSLIDSISDRVSEFIWALALYMAGLNGFLISIFICCAWVQEYLRARAGGLGYRKIGLVTISERPTRAIFIALVLAMAKFELPILILATIVQLISLITITRKIKKEINL